MCVRRSSRKEQVNLWAGVPSTYYKIHLLCQPLKQCTRSLRPDLLCVRRSFLGKRKYDPCYKWCDEPAVEDDFASSGDFGVAALIRALIKALEAQGRGFAHGHEKHHSEPRTKAIDIIQLFLGCRHAGAAEHGQDSRIQITQLKRS